MVLPLVTVYSSIRPEFKRHVLLRGSGFSIVGALLVLVSGLFLPPFWMQYFGFPLLIIGIMLIAYGMIPYRRLTRLEAEPHQLVLTEDHHLRYFMQGQPILTIPIDVIERVSYCDEAVERYGIALDLKAGGAQRVSLHKRSATMSSFIAQTRQRYACDFFFPYFSQRSYREIQKKLRLES